MNRMCWSRLAFAGALIAFLAGAGSAILAQYIALPHDLPPRLKKRRIVDELPAAPKFPPAFSVPIEPLGFGPPGPAYLGRHETLLSLDFLDESRLLFSFPEPGLIQRRATGTDSGAARRMHAVVLTLPDGKVESQATWTVPDTRRYLWMLKDGLFLLRDRDGLRIGNSSLETKPFLEIPGEIISVQIDPAQTVIVTNSIEASARTNVSANASAATPPADSRSNVVVRTAELSSGQVMMTQHVPAASQLPINSQGHVDITHDKFDQWSLWLNGFHDEGKVIGHVQSNCPPLWSFVSDQEILVTGCNPDHGWKLLAVTTNGQQLWQTDIPAPLVPPLLVTAPDGSRFARETIVLNEGAKPGPQTLWIKAVKGQAVRIFDAATGRIVLETPVSPTLDAGGNVAFSPSGRRIAVLNTGTIQVFDLPPANP